MMDDWDLLQQFAEDRSETAFAELVRRHLNWVYSVARRQVDDAHLAEDVAQSVFVLLARKAGNLRRGTVLTGWLFRTTCYVSSCANRSERRRRQREEKASAMSPTFVSPQPNEVLWNQLSPRLDEAVAALSEADRSAILLRFYDKKSLREVGERLGISEDAAKKRLSRAVGKLRESLTKRGVVLGGVALIGILAEQTVHAAPATLAASVLKVAVASTSPAAILPHLARETLNAWRMTKLKLVGGVAAVSVVAVTLVIGSRLHGAPDSGLTSTTAIEAAGKPAPNALPQSPARVRPTTINDEFSITGGSDTSETNHLFGVVRTRDGAPVSNANVYLVTPGHILGIYNGRTHPRSGLEGLTHVVTGGDGRFVLPQPDEPFRIVALHDEQGCAESTGAPPDLILLPWARVAGDIYFGSDAAAGQAISLQRSAEIPLLTNAGTLVTPLGQTVTTMRVSAGPDVEYWGSTTSDDTGHFVLERVPPATVKVARTLPVNERTHALRFTHSVLLTLQPGKTGYVTLGGSGKAVVGRLIAPADSDSQPDWSEYEANIRGISSSNAAAAGQDYPVLLQADGTFRVEDVPAGTYELQVRAAVGGSGCSVTASGRRNPIDYLTHQFRLAETSTLNNDEPLDLGPLPLNLVKPLPGDMAPPLECLATDGRVVRLADYRGKFVLLDFWGIWCTHSMDDFPYLKDIDQSYGQDGRLVIVGLDIEMSPDLVREIPKVAAKNNLPWPQGVLGEDWRDGASSITYGLESIPNVMLIGPDGKVVARDLHGDDIKTAVASALGR